MSNVTALTSAPVLTIAHVQRLGTDENFRGGRAAAVIASMPEGYDWTARGAVPAAVFSALGIEKSAAPAQKTGKEKKETTFGVGFRVLCDAIRYQVKGNKVTEAGVIRVSLSGEGGQTLTLREGDAGYAEAVALYSSLAAATDADADAA